MPTLLLLSGEWATVVDGARTGWQERGRQEYSVGNTNKNIIIMQVNVIQQTKITGEDTK